MRDDDEEQKWTRQIKKEPFAPPAAWLELVGLFSQDSICTNPIVSFSPSFIYFPSFFLILSS